MKKLFSILTFALFAGVMLWASDACAAAVWDTAFRKVTEAFQNSRKLIFIVGGFGLIVLAFFAIFGKVNWKWFAALCVGLAIVAVAGQVIDYVTIDNTGNTAVLKEASMTGNTMTLTSGSGSASGS